MSTNSAPTTATKPDEQVSWRREGDAAVVTIDHPPVNALSHAARTGLVAALEQIEATDGITGVVVTGTGRHFCSGADVSQFNTPAATADPRLQAVVERLAASPLPIVAAIQGSALGGGLELALGVAYRIADGTARLGLTETTLGLIPGGGGTQRLPRVIGAGPALDAILDATQFTADKALAVGLVDEVFEGDPAAAGLDFLARRLAEGSEHPVIDAVEASAEGVDFEVARTRARRNRRNGRAQLAAIDSVGNATRMPLDEGLTAEAELFAELVAGPESKALRYLFFAERTARKVDSIPKGTAVHPIATTGVIGSGTMGSGIAMSLADGGLPVTVVDTTEEALGRAQTRIDANYASLAKKGRISAEEATARTERITLTTSQEDVQDADLVIEAVFEDLEIKRTLFVQLDATVKDGAILATNTSRLDVNLIAEVTRRPQYVVGLHFFSPANVMKLLEVVQGAQTSDDVVATAMVFAGRIDKQPVLSQVGEGFIGNRMLSPYRHEAEQLLEAGATPAQVDAALEGFGFGMGPMAVSDLAGIDVGEAGRRTFRTTATPEQLVALSRIPTKIFEAGMYGQKTGAGYYRYLEGDRTRHENPRTLEIIEQCATESGTERRAVSDEEIVERCVLALVNEGAKLLDEGIAQRASDVDVVWVAGYGFPAFRGGPLHYASTLGLERVVARMREFEQTLGSYWAPASLLVRLVEAERTDFSDLSAVRVADGTSADAGAGYAGDPAGR